MRVLLVRPEGKRPLGRQRHTWKHNIKMDIQELDGGVWNGLLWLMMGASGGLL
jgi:hypothetical protein